MTGRDAPWVLGVDSGGSGVRFALRRADAAFPAEVVTSKEPVRTGPAGIDAAHLVEQLLPAVEELSVRTGARRIAAVAVGAAGMATLGDGLRAELPGALARSLGVRTLALAADAVTAYAGALGRRAGVVVAAGTGMIALGTDLAGWRRADGWGHLLGDCGGGAWIGRAGLDAALRRHDGRPDGSAALLARLKAVFGAPGELPGKLYPRDDRAAVLASFAPEVAACAEGDPVAAGILRDAARHIVATAAAVCPPAGADEELQIAFTGGLLKLGEPLLVPLREELHRQLPYARTVEAAGDPLAGSLAIAAGLAQGELGLPRDERMLWIVTD
ncbi:N-acetylmuramic acid/N-acetylglucosamine kinase [Streptomyces hundungensis]|uniref:N-acetylmuramic acid/N-acetylglucosamine kinase n=1 Tax=Streptomyces hundungensis TaxID=1077946 RepID=A0A387HLF1_9ACTN|nr:BadF/BadG/BcrA/BcrD ATPase family protein [Streptomyces hundungensis]AYG84319.1 N-acetylmuramic acid/N-acetylglucosamine kinase [Streptomyces hundungensis]